MPRYKLRTLLIVLALGPPTLAWGWVEYQRAITEQKRQAEITEALNRLALARLNLVVDRPAVILKPAPPIEKKRLPPPCGYSLHQAGMAR